MRFYKNNFRVSGFLAASLALTACGGGGGGGGTNAPSPALRISPSSLSFAASGTSSMPAAQNIVGTIENVSSGALYVLISSSGAAVGSVSSFMVLTETSGQVSVSPRDPLAAGVGIHTGSVVIRACLNDPSCLTGNLAGSPSTVDVRYTVPGLRASQPTVEYALQNNPSTADLVRQLVISTVPVQNWTAFSNQDWLSVTSSGTNGSTLTASLVLDRLSTLNNGIHGASITMVPAVAGDTLTIPVTVSIQRTQINSVTPYVTYPGISRSVIVRGEGFSQANITNVLFGETPAESFRFLGADEIRAVYPASLAEGRHPIRLASDADSVRGLADLVVVRAPEFAAALLPYPVNSSSPSPPAAVNALAFDAERGSLGISLWHDNGSTRFIRYQSIANVWQPPATVSAFNHFGLSLTADGSEWILGSGRSVIHVRASDLAVTASVESPLNLNGQQNLTEFAAVGDGKMVMFGDVNFGCDATQLHYDVRNQAFAIETRRSCRANAGSSADGSMALALDQFDQSTPDDVFFLSPLNGARTATGIHWLSGVSPVLDQTGSRILLDKTRIYNGDYIYLGNLPSSTIAAILDPDGTRAFAYDNSGFLMIYDLQAEPIGGLYPAIGAGIALAGDPGPSKPAFTTAEVMMAVTPDGRAVFIAGKNGIVVQPLP